ncbi:MAG TPA: type II CAAX endopeptidase family protein [Terracidiphilus sp.]|nr:type II CAAX endopeptidase family protein [Terracidiphilus sp.]
MIAPYINAPNLIAALFTLVPYLAAAFFPSLASRLVRGIPLWAQLACPSLLCIPYLLVACAAHDFRSTWFALYLLLPVAIAILLWEAGRIDADQRGNWRDFFVLVVLGLAVDLRWFEAAWPAHLAIFSKILLLDAGIYGFLFIRRLDGVGFDLRLRLFDLAIGLREVLFYTPIALAVGLGLHFLHLHVLWRGLGAIAFAWFFTFFFVAVPEELFFRGWLQNLLERRMGRYPALFLTAALFGLAHFNKHTVGFRVHFNWRYVLMAAIAGVFYGRAWRSRRRVGASAITHATVDSIWSLWLR